LVNNYRIITTEKSDGAGYLRYNIRITNSEKRLGKKNGQKPKVIELAKKYGIKIEKWSGTANYYTTGIPVTQGILQCF